MMGAEAEAEEAVVVQRCCCCLTFCSAAKGNGSGDENVFWLILS